MESELQDYINEKKKLQELILQIIEKPDANDSEFQNLLDYLNMHQYEKNKSELKHFLHLILIISNNHHRQPNFFEKIEKILTITAKFYKPTFSNEELFIIFQQSKPILLFLLKLQIITIDKKMFKYLLGFAESKDGELYYYFYPELDAVIKSGAIESINTQNYDLKLNEDIEKFEANRFKFENDSELCYIIRNDLIDEFIKYINKNNISLLSQIKRSTFETNSMFIEKDPTLIEYSAFFGSIQIMKYLLINNAKMNPSIWLYAIHSNNPEIIQILEEKKIAIMDRAFQEAIKCHHNDIARYIFDNYFDYSENIKDLSEENLSVIYLSANYEFFCNCIDENKFFYILCESEYYELIDLYLKFKHDEINNYIVNKRKDLDEKQLIIQTLIDKRLDIFYQLMQKFDCIPDFYFANESNINRIVLPPTIKSIKEGSFINCKCLHQIAIPSSVESIGKSAFMNCSSLTDALIPSSIKSIGQYAFKGCLSLRHITIPISIESIGNNAFEDVPYESVLLIVNQFLFNLNQQLNGLIILNSIKYIDEEISLEISKKFLLNKNKAIRIESLKLLNKLIISSINNEELKEQITSLIIKYSESIFQFKSLNDEYKEFNKILYDYNIYNDDSLDLECIYDKIEEIIDAKEYSTDLRIALYSLMNVQYYGFFNDIDENIFTKILQLTLDTCQNDRFTDDYLFAEDAFKKYSHNFQYLPNFFRDNIEKLSKSKNLSDIQVALLLIKTSIEVMDLNDCNNYIDLTLKLGDCEDEKIIYYCNEVFYDFNDTFNESILNKFDQISKFMLKNIKISNSLINLKSLIEVIHRPPDYFTNFIDSLLLILKSQEKSRKTEILKCINSCLILPFDQPFNSASKIFDIVFNGMNSKEFEMPISLKILGNLVFCSPKLIKNNLEKIIKVCQLNLKNSTYLAATSECIRNISSYFPDSMLPFLPDIVQPMLDFVSKYNFKDKYNDIIEIAKCLCQIGLEYDEFTEKYDKLFWNRIISADYRIFSTSVKFFAKRGFPIKLLLTQLLNYLQTEDDFQICCNLTTIQQSILFLPFDCIFNYHLMKDIGSTLLNASEGSYTNLLIYDTIIPNNYCRKIYDCLYAYVDIFKNNLNRNIQQFLECMNQYINYSNLKNVLFLHFFAKFIAFCDSEDQMNFIINSLIKNLFLVLTSIQKVSTIDLEKMTHIVLSLIYIIRAKKDSFKLLIDLFISFLVKIDSNSNFEFILAYQTFILNSVMLYELPIDDNVKNILKEIKFAKNMEVLPLLADCLIYIFKKIGDENLPLLKKYASILFSSERYILDLIDKKILQFYSSLINSLKQDELLFYTNLNESSIHQISRNVKEFSS